MSLWHAMQGWLMASLLMGLIAMAAASTDRLLETKSISQHEPLSQQETLSQHETLQPITWHLEKQSGGITIHSRAVAGSAAREVRATTALRAGVVAVTHFLQDPVTNPRWVPSSQSVSIFERPSPAVSLVHFVMSASWPFQPRDAVARFELRQTPASVVWIRFDSQPQRLPLVPGAVRLETYSGCWRLTPIASGQTHLEYRSHIEAGGHIPAWVANSVAIRSTFKALKNLRRQVPDYGVPSNSPLPFLREATVFVPNIDEMGDRDCERAFAEE